MTSGAEDVLVDSDALLLHDDLSETQRGHYCEQALSVGSAATRAEIVVTFPEAGDRIGIGADVNGRQPKKRGVIAIGDTMRVRAIAGDTIDFSDPMVLAGITDPTDFQTIGGTISKFCEVLGNHYQVTLCVDSISDLLAHNEPKQVFRFTHLLLKRLESVDAVAHVHIDPDAHDERLLRTFGDLFDQEFVEFEADESALDVTPDRSRATASDVTAAYDEASDSDEPTQSSSSSEATDEDIARALRD